MPSPTFAVAVIFNIKEGHEQEFHAVVKKQAINSLELEPWCHQFDVCVDSEDPKRFFLYETYDDAGAFEKHRATPHFADFAAKVSDWVASKELNTWSIDELVPASNRQDEQE